METTQNYERLKSAALFGCEFAGFFGVASFCAILIVALFDFLFLESRTENPVKAAIELGGIITITLGLCAFVVTFLKYPTKPIEKLKHGKKGEERC